MVTFRGRPGLPPTLAWQQGLSIPTLVRRGLRRADPSSYSAAWMSVAAGPSDPFFSSVVLLMGFEGANGATNGPGMTDESPAAHGLGAAGAGTAISTAQFKFGSSSLLTNNNLNALLFPDSNDFNLDSALFTVEMQVNPSVLPATQGFLIGQWASVPNLGWIMYLDGTSGNQIALNVSTTGSDNIVQMIGGSMSTGSWQAVCMDFDGTKYRMYVNGVMVASSTTLRTIHDSSLQLSIANNPTTGSFPYKGNTDEIRITKGVARYASDGGYTPATARFPRS